MEEGGRPSFPDPLLPFSLGDPMGRQKPEEKKVFFLVNGQIGSDGDIYFPPHRRRLVRSKGSSLGSILPSQLSAVPRKK